MEFVGSSRPTIGVEIELQLIDPDTRDLTPKSIQLLELCEKAGLDRVKAEITQSMIEVNSEVCDDVKEARKHLEWRIATLRTLAGELGVELNSSGTHPFQRWTERKIHPTERYVYILDKFKWLARRLTVYGVHVHVGVENGEKAIALSNALMQYLPHLLALSASSPYWESVDTGMASCRAGIMESFPISGLPYYFPNWKEFEKYCEVLQRSGAIVSLKDLYWYLRPNPEFGTIEFRICDAMPTLKETMALVAMMHCLVVWVSEGLAAGTRSRTVRMHRYWIAPENQWVAARDGLDAMIITNQEGERRNLKNEILHLVDQLDPIATRLNCREELSDVREIVQSGTSASRQRMVFEESQSLQAVVDALINEFKMNTPTPTHV